MGIVKVMCWKLQLGKYKFVVLIYYLVTLTPHELQAFNLKLYQKNDCGDYSGDP